ncbi:MAG: CPBP family intramembrane metalloprotease [Oscillospiraceae bacterium]|jgi:membrane protease YdiL (CAAX protease family)|nr:CPBP family intramembrane metalloprotease [Oscillospiraceae bacterium]
MLKTRVLAIIQILAVALLHMLLQLALALSLRRWFDAESLLWTQSISFAAVVGVQWIVVRGVCRTPFSAIGIRPARGWARHWLMGAACGAALVVTIWGVIWLMGGYRLGRQATSAALWQSLGVSALMMTMVGYSEEALCRGVMAFVARRAGQGFVAIAVGVVFSLMHLFNPNYSPLAMLNTLLAAVVFSQMTWITDDLWMAIGCHSAWNFCMSLLGVHVSGLSIPGFLYSQYTTAGLLTGGEYGLEASVPCTVGFALVIAALAGSSFKRSRGLRQPAK